MLEAGIDIHYISNITGHGLRKIMRARQSYTYVLEKVFDPQEVFNFIQKLNHMFRFCFSEHHGRSDTYVIE